MADFLRFEHMAMVIDGQTGIERAVPVDFEARSGIGMPVEATQSSHGGD